MRARNLKPSFFSNEDLGTLSPLARILFQGLWCEADCEGRLEDRPLRLKTLILPYDECDADALLADLHRAGLIRRYEVDGKKFLVVPTFKRHQNPHVNEKKKGSTIPAPDLHQTSTVLVPDLHQTSPAESLFLNPESGIPLPDSGFLNPEPEEEDPPTPQGGAGDGGQPRGKASSGNTLPELRAVVAKYTADPSLRQALEDFRVMRERIRKPMTGKALTLILTKLDALARDGPGKIAILEQSVLNSWQGLFPLKGPPQSGTSRLSDKEQRTVNAINAWIGRQDE